MYGNSNKALSVYSSNCQLPSVNAYESINCTDFFGVSIWCYPDRVLFSTKGSNHLKFEMVSSTVLINRIDRNVDYFTH